MNILLELTRHLALASKDLKIEPKIIPVLPEKKTEVSKPLIFIPSLLIQKPEIKPLSLENLASALPSIQRIDLNLGKIQTLSEDKSISLIVCDGPMKPLKIKREGKLESTPLILDSSEIDSIIQQFSKKSNLPIRPVFRAKVSNISMLALISPIESRFMLTLE